jgi:hypothetical protein
MDGKDNVITISTGDPSTLGTYLKLSKDVWGEDSAAVKFILKKIEESPNRENEEVIAHETQMFYALNAIMQGSKV